MVKIVQPTQEILASSDGIKWAAYPDGDKPSSGIVSINFSQVDISWTSRNDSVTLLERADSVGGPYVVQAWAKPGESTKRLNNHRSSTEYFYRLTWIGATGAQLAQTLLGANTTPAAIRQLYIATTGSDSNDGLSSGNAFLTLNKAASVQAAGDEVIIASGTYYDSTNTSAHVTTREWTSEIDAAVATQITGTEASPIVWRTAPGDEGSVVFNFQESSATYDGAGDFISQGTAVAGFYIVTQHNYYQFYDFDFTNGYGMFIGCKNVGTAPEDAAVTSSNYANNIIIENCRMQNLTAQSGENSAPISGWGTKDWLIHNVYINAVEQQVDGRGNGFGTFGTLGLTLSNITMRDCDNGVQFKDHFITGTSPRTTSDNEAHIIGCDIEGRDNGISSINRGSTSNEAGGLLVEYCRVSATTYGVFHNMEGAEHGPSNTVDVRNSTLNGGSFSFRTSSTSGAYLYGNVYADQAMEFISREWVSSGGAAKYTVRLKESNYSAFTDDQFSVQTDRYNTVPGSVAQTFSTLATWQATSTNSGTLEIGTPDLNSVEDSRANMFNNYAAGDLTLKTGSPAIAAMSDSTDMGCYRYNIETLVGVLPNFNWVI